MLVEAEEGSLPTMCLDQARLGAVQVLAQEATTRPQQLRTTLRLFPVETLWQIAGLVAEAVQDSLRSQTGQQAMAAQASLS